MLIREVINGKMLADSAVIRPTVKPMTPDQLQVKALTDRSKQLKSQAKQMKATQRLQKAQSQVAAANQSLTPK